jgi:hypothetical protein
MILATMTDPHPWRCFISDNAEGCAKHVFQGHAEALGNVRWWTTARSKSRQTSFSFRKTPGELWSEGVLLGKVFSNGLDLELAAVISKLDERGTEGAQTSNNTDTSYNLNIMYTHRRQRVPVVYFSSVCLVAVGAETLDLQRSLEVYDFRKSGIWLITLVGPVQGLADATTALQPFLNADGTLKLDVGITVP